MKAVKCTNISEVIEVLDEDIIKDFMNCNKSEDCNGCLAFIDLGGFTFCSLLQSYKSELTAHLLSELEKI